MSNTSDDQSRPWTFLTSHARVLIVIAQNPDLRVRDIAAVAHITERSTQRIVADLEAAGYLSHERNGRRNHYRVKPTETFRHPHEQSLEIGSLLGLFSDLSAERAAGTRHPQSEKPETNLDD